jgi:hypothetical protein
LIQDLKEFITFSPFDRSALLYPALKGGVEESYMKWKIFLPGCEALPFGRTPAL